MGMGQIGYGAEKGWVKAGMVQGKGEAEVSTR